MVNTIKILHGAKVKTPWVNYKKDFRMAFASKDTLLKELKEQRIVQAEKGKDSDNKDQDGNSRDFKNSSISRNDFYLFGLYNKIDDILKN